MARSGMDLQGCDNTLRAVRTSCATDRGKSACWWPNPGLSSCSVRACPCPGLVQWHRAGCLQAAETLQSGDGPAALLKLTARDGDPRTPRGRCPVCFRPPPPCPWAAAIMHRAKARLLRCCRCRLVNVDTLPCAVPSFPPQTIWAAIAVCCLLAAALSFVALVGHLLRQHFLALPQCFVPVTVLPSRSMC